MQTWTPLSESSLGFDLTPVLSAIRNSIAPKTWTEYSVAWDKWLSFNMELGFSGLSSTEHSILAFICSLMQLHFSFNHINKTLVGVTFFLKFLNLPACNSNSNSFG